MFRLLGNLIRRSRMPKVFRLINGSDRFAQPAYWSCLFTTRKSVHFPRRISYFWTESHQILIIILFLLIMQDFHFSFFLIQFRLRNVIGHSSPTPSQLSVPWSDFACSPATTAIDYRTNTIHYRHYNSIIVVAYVRITKMFRPKSTFGNIHFVQPVFCLYLYQRGN